MNGVVGSVTANGSCEDHQTDEENAREEDALNRFRATLGLPPLEFDRET